LVANDRFRDHLGFWQGKIPAGFHRFLKARMHLLTGDIFKEAQKKWKGFP